MAEYQPWTPESVRETARALFGPTWQTRLARAISEAAGIDFPPVRIRHWFLEKNGRPIPQWVQSTLGSVFMQALVAHDSAREVAVRELQLRLGKADPPDDNSPM